MSFRRPFSFKYISCYSLSTSNGFLFVLRTHSNTSHVILYRQWPPPSRWHPGIQIHLMLFFIYLIHRKARHPLSIQIHLMLFFINSIEEAIAQYCIFKYISCYSLSDHAGNSVFEECEFKYISCYSLSRRHLKKRFAKAIQIHLMLFFICHRSSPVSSLILFKYISCYSLSKPQHATIGKPTVFKYISCYSLSI